MSLLQRTLLLNVALMLAVSGCSGSGPEQPSVSPTDAAPPTPTSQLPNSSPTIPAASVPPTTPAPTPDPAPATTAPPAPEPPADVIFYNGPVLTMDPDLPQAEALGVRGDMIVAVGPTDEVMALSGPDTVLIDLAGNALLPGFVDPHTHPFTSDFSPETMMMGQQRLLEGGITSIGETAMDPGKIEALLGAMESTDLRIRIVAYLLYNTKCFGLHDPPGWIQDYTPILDPGDKLTIPGVKIILDPAGPNTRCGWAEMSVPLPADFVEFRNAELYGKDLFTEDEVTDLIIQHQTLGFQVAMHARGDITVEKALNAIERALDGQSNTLRHRIEHNDFIRPELVSRYGEVGAIPTVRGRPYACVTELLDGQHFFGEEFEPWFRVARTLIEANPGLPVAWHSDTGNTSTRTPIVDLYNLVTKRAIDRDGNECEPPDWLAAEAVSVENALRMMTINGAYALFLDDYVGSLKPGKFADLIILSANPLTIDTDEIINLEVIMTMVAGTVEHCLTGNENHCP